MGSPRVLVAGLAVVILWASAFPAIKVASPQLGVIGLSLVRLLVAAAALLLIAPFAKVRVPAGRDWPLVFACGFFGMTAYQLLLNWGELSVPAGTASIIVAAAPLVSVAIATAVFRERLTVLTVVGSMIAIGGVAMVCLVRSGLSVTNAIWIVVAATVVQGIYHPLTKPMLRTYSGLEVATYAIVTGTVMTLPLLPFGWSALSDAQPSGWLAAVYLGLLPSAAGFVLWGYTVARLPVATSTSLLYLVPAVAVVVSYVWLHEVPYPAEIVGGAVIVLGVIIVGQGDRLRLRIAAVRRGSAHPHSTKGASAQRIEAEGHEPAVHSRMTHAVRHGRADDGASDVGGRGRGDRGEWSRCTARPAR